jgi:hypothetical protein
MVLVATSAVAADTTSSTAASKSTTAAKAPKAAKGTGAATAGPWIGLEPKALEILKASSQRLAAARTLSFTARVGYEHPSRFGLPLLYTLRSDVSVKRPDKLSVITPGDGPASEFYYDGKSIMAYSPAENLVAVASAPPTIDGALNLAHEASATFFPFSDLVVADPYGEIANKLKVAFYIGQSNVVGGVKTDIVAYQLDHVFVQMWIGADDKLPRMARAIYRGDPAALRHTAEYSNWQLDQPLADDAFTSAAASKAQRINFARPDPVLLPKKSGATSGASSKGR